MKSKLQLQRENNYDLVMIVTCIDSKYIMHMINSVLINNNIVSTLIIFINQSDLVYNLGGSNSKTIIKELKSNKISLSKARNIGINYLIINQLKFSHTMFPDDDSTFSESFFSNFKPQKERNYLIDVYGEGTERLFKKNRYHNGKVLGRYNYDAAMSVNMIINHKTFSLVGFFDERLGVGAKYGAGEDADYYIRACNVNLTGFIYNKHLFNFHPSSPNKFSKMKLSRVVDVYIKYGQGGIFTLCKHKMYKAALKSCFWAIGGAAMSLIKFNFKLFLAYIMAFFARTLMLINCIVNSKKLYKNA